MQEAVRFDIFKIQQACPRQFATSDFLELLLPLIALTELNVKPFVLVAGMLVVGNITSYPFRLLILNINKPIDKSILIT